MSEAAGLFHVMLLVNHAVAEVVKHIMHLHALISFLFADDLADECYSSVEAHIFTYVDDSVLLLILFIIVIMQRLEQN